MCYYINYIVEKNDRLWMIIFYFKETVKRLILFMHQMVSMFENVCFRVGKNFNDFWKKSLMFTKNAFIW